MPSAVNRTKVSRTDSTRDIFEFHRGVDAALERVEREE